MPDYNFVSNSIKGRIVLLNIPTPRLWETRMTAPQRHVANTANYMLRLQWFSMARIFIAPSAMLFNGAEIIIALLPWGDPDHTIGLAVFAGYLNVRPAYITDRPADRPRKRCGLKMKIGLRSIAEV